MSKKYRFERSETILGMSRFAFITTAIAVVVLAGITAAVVFLNGQMRPSTELPPSAEGSAIIQEDGGIVISKGDIDVDVYIDPLCPACKNFEEVYTPALLETEGVGVTVHPISILDRASAGTKYSTRSAASVYAVAVAAPEKVADYIEALYNAQPAEGGPGLTNEEFISIAESVGADITEDDIKEFTRFVTGITPETPLAPNGNISTPTMTADGEYIVVTGDPLADIAALTE